MAAPSPTRRPTATRCAARPGGPAPRHRPARLPLQRDDRSLAALRHRWRNLVSGRSQLGPRGTVSEAVPGDDPELAAGLGPRQVPLLLRADRAAPEHDARDPRGPVADLAKGRSE